MDPVFLVYMVKPADDPNTMIAIPSCKAVGPSVGDATGCCADASSGMLKIFFLESGGNSRNGKLVLAFLRSVETISSAQAVGQDTEIDCTTSKENDRLWSSELLISVLCGIDGSSFP